MASVLLGNPLASGGQPVISGNPWSGIVTPIGGIQFRLHPNASGNAYIGLSGGIATAGGVTLNSGGFFLSGGGLQDGMILAPGDAYFIPKIAFNQSGTYNVFAFVDAAGSGQARLYYEPRY